MRKELERVPAWKLGIDPKAIARFAERLDKNGAHSFMILRHGKVAAEAWWAPYRPEYNHMMYSLSKSFTSTAVGFAVQEGLLKLDDKVISFFPEALPSEPCANMLKMKVRDLLMMASGHDVEPAIRNEQDWVSAFLKTYVAKEPGVQDEANSLFLYNSIDTYMASAIVQKVTGQTVYDYLKPRLLDPLGIEGTWFETCPKGINTGGWGFNIKTEDIARFSQFLLQKGVWEGRQLLNAAWIEEATGWQIDCASFDNTDDWKQGYCYQFWRCVQPGAYRMDGMWGQFGVVMPEQDMVVAMTNGTSQTPETLNAIWEELVPALTDGEACAEGQEELEARLKALTTAVPEGTKKAFGGKYILGDNALDIASIELDLKAEGKDRVILTRKNGVMDVAVGFCGYEDSVTDCGEAFNSTASKMFDEVSAAGAWTAEDTYELRMTYNRTPYTHTVTVKLYEGCAEFTWKQTPDHRQGTMVMVGRKA